MKLDYIRLRSIDHTVIELGLDFLGKTINFKHHEQKMLSQIQNQSYCTLGIRSFFEGAMFRRALINTIYFKNRALSSPFDPTFSWDE